MNDKLYLTQTEYIIAYIPIQSYKYGRQFQQQQRFFLNAKANLEFMHGIIINRTWRIICDVAWMTGS